jgi:Holliday junction resolvase RusA-like endonuclease
VRRRPGGPAPARKSEHLELGTGQVIELHVAGKTATKGRARFGAGGQVYTPPSNIISENDVRAVWREAGEPRIEDDIAIAIEVRITVVRPKGHFLKGGNLSAKGLEHPIPRNKKPDVDNALKLVMDALNTRAYRDDVLVARAIVERHWGEWPETRIRIYGYKEEPASL